MRTKHSCSEMVPLIVTLSLLTVPTFLKAPLTKVLMSAVLPTPLPPSTRTLQEAMPRLLSTALRTMATLSPSCLRHHRRPDTHWTGGGHDVVTLVIGSCRGGGMLCKARCVILLWSGDIKLRVHVMCENKSVKFLNIVRKHPVQCHELFLYCAKIVDREVLSVTTCVVTT